MKRALVATAVLAMACGGTDTTKTARDPLLQAATDGKVYGAPPDGMLYLPGTIIDACSCILDQGEQLFGIEIPEPTVCKSGTAVSQECSGLDVSKLCPCAIDSPATTCEKTLPAGSHLVLQRWVCK